MKKHDMIFMVGLLVLSVLSSFVFTFYGLSIVMSERVAHKTSVFAYVTIAYGLGNLAILSLAWSSREVWASTVYKLIAFCFMGVFIMDMIIRKSAGGLEAVGGLILAVILCANWFAVKAVIERE